MVTIILTIFLVFLLALFIVLIDGGKRING
jgi:hypothetical protein